MPYLIHFLDDTDDKPQELSEKDARTVIWEVPRSPFFTVHLVLPTVVVW